MSYEHLVAGTVGGLTSTVILHPLDLLKVRFAVSDGSKLKKNYSGIRKAISTIIKEEGFRGLYKGVAPNCIGAGTAWGLYFLFYNSFKKHILEDSRGPLKHMLAGACAGAITTAITNPIWVVKTRLCLQYDGPGSAATVSPREINRYSGTWDAFKKVYKYEGYRGLYKGFIPGLLGVSHGAIQLAAYEEMKKFYLTQHDLPIDHKLGTLQYISCAALSKLLAASVTYPYQVVRARLQDQHVHYRGLIDVVKRTWRYESYLGFYKGFSAYMFHVTPNVCIVFFVYETVKNYVGAKD